MSNLLTDAMTFAYADGGATQLSNCDLLSHYTHYTKMDNAAFRAELTLKENNNLNKILTILKVEIYDRMRHGS